MSKEVPVIDLIEDEKLNFTVRGVSIRSSDEGVTTVDFALNADFAPDLATVRVAIQSRTTNQKEILTCAKDALLRVLRDASIDIDSPIAAEPS